MANQLGGTDAAFPQNYIDKIGVRGSVAEYQRSGLAFGLDEIAEDTWLCQDFAACLTVE
jgi:hypothetical protein